MLPRGPQAPSGHGPSILHSTLRTFILNTGCPPPAGSRSTISALPLTLCICLALYGLECG